MGFEQSNEMILQSRKTHNTTCTLSWHESTLYIFGCGVVVHNGVKYFFGPPQCGGLSMRCHQVIV